MSEARITREELQAVIERSQPTYREREQLARMQAGIALDILSAGNYSQALLYLEDACLHLREAVRLIGEAAKRGETAP